MEIRFLFFHVNCLDFGGLLAHFFCFFWNGKFGSNWSELTLTPAWLTKKKRFSVSFISNIHLSTYITAEKQTGSINTCCLKGILFYHLTLHLSSIHFMRLYAIELSKFGCYQKCSSECHLTGHSLVDGNTNKKRCLVNLSFHWNQCYKHFNQACLGNFRFFFSFISTHRNRLWSFKSFAQTIQKRAKLWLLHSMTPKFIFWWNYDRRWWFALKHRATHTRILTDVLRAQYLRSIFLDDAMAQRNKRKTNGQIIDHNKQTGKKGIGKSEMAN